MSTVLPRLLVPLDGSDLAESVLPWVLGTLGASGGEVLLLRVVPLPPQEFVDSSTDLSGNLHRAALEHAEVYLHQVAARLRDAGLAVDTEVLETSGAVAEHIVDFARERAVDMIAMCTHGRTGPARWLLGSVAERVVRAAACPVYVHRAPRGGAHAA